MNTNGQHTSTNEQKMHEVLLQYRKRFSRAIQKVLQERGLIDESPDKNEILDVIRRCERRENANAKWEGTIPKGSESVLEEVWIDAKECIVQSRRSKDEYHIYNAVDHEFIGQLNKGDAAHE